MSSPYVKLWPNSKDLFTRFGVEGSGVKYNAHSLWKNWTGVDNWVCSYVPIQSTLIYDCIPEVWTTL